MSESYRTNPLRWRIQSPAQGNAALSGTNNRSCAAQSIHLCRFNTSLTVSRLNIITYSNYDCCNCSCMQAYSRSPALTLGSNIPPFNWSTTQTKHTIAVVNQWFKTRDMLTCRWQILGWNLFMLRQIVEFPEVLNYEFLKFSNLSTYKEADTVRIMILYL